jgi:hypothetical protein
VFWGWAVAILISDNPAAAEVCLNLIPPKIGFECNFSVWQVPDLPQPESVLLPYKE